MAAVVGVADVERILAFAKHYPVFPCRPRDEMIGDKLFKAKSPLTKNGFHAATQDPTQIRQWWRQWPDAYVGVPTGQATGLVVIDYDPDKATQATHAWIAEHTELLCSTRTHQTGRDGRHYLFRSTDRYQTGTDLILDGSPRRGIDLRAAGGYVIWWPIHGQEVVNESLRPLPADLIEERRFVAERIAPFPRRAPADWNGERDKVRDALASFPPGGYERWIRIGMAIHHASGGSEGGFSVWHDWSAKDDAYDGIDDCRYHWQTFGNYEGRALGLGSVFQIAKEHGYVQPVARRDEELPPLELYVNDFDQIDNVAHVTLPEAERREIKAREYPWVEPRQIPPREWLYGFHYMRGMVSASAGSTGAGKSTLTLPEVLSMVLGRDLLRNGMALPCGPLKVWYHNGEDPLVELQRRIQAVCLYYSIKREDLGGRLRVTSGRDTRIVLAAEIQRSIAVFDDVRDGLIEELKREEISVLVVDPFVATHRLSENDNAAMEQLMTVYRDVADQARCAVELTAHFRKAGGAGEPSAEDLRGASAIISAARSVRVVACMTEGEAQAAEVNPDDRGRYVWLGNPKGNMTMSSRKKLWRYIESVNLRNAKAPYPDDEIGVAREWTHPGVAVNNLSPAERRQIQSAISRADPLTQARASPTATGWAGHLVIQTLDLDPADEQTRAQVKNILSSLEIQKLLVRKSIYDPAKGRQAVVYTAASD